MNEEYLDAYNAMMEAYVGNKGAIDGLILQKPKKESDCPYCDGSGYMTVYKMMDGQRFEFMQKCQCFNSRTKQARMENSNLPKAFTDKTFEEYDPGSDVLMAEAKDKAIAYAQAFKADGPSIYFYGMPGSGKTHLCVAICNEVVNQGFDVQYMVYREAVTVLMQCKYKRDEYAKEINKYKHCSLLYIDDLFKGRPSNDERNIVYEILDNRAKAELPVVISSGISPEGLRHLDGDIYQRIYAMCKTESDINIVNLGSPNSRGRA